MGQSEPLRRSAIAGTWFPDDPRALEASVARYLDAADTATHLNVRAVIAPHAGLIYSGPVAAHAYHALIGRSYDVAVLVGPSHFVGFEGVSVFARGAFETPLGPVCADGPTADQLLDADPGLLIEYPRAHEREHSLEMQLPFLKHVLADMPIVPLVMGFQTRDTVLRLADALARVLAGRRALLIASTDLSHYFDATRAAELDARVVDLVAGFDAKGLLGELERYPESERGRSVACGGGPAVAVMSAARALGSTHASVLKRADSSDVSGDRTAVVGYLAAVMGTMSP